MITNVKIYGFDDSIKASKYPMAVDIEKCTAEITNRTESLAQCEKGTGHDNFLNGIIVQFDLTFSLKAWTEMQRYHFIDFVSSQSTMHRITKFDLDKSYNEYVDPMIIEIMKQKVQNYNTYCKVGFNTDWFAFHDLDIESEKEYQDFLKEKYLEILYSNPAGFQLTARMTTNYRQLKIIYSQRKTHKLPEWRIFCQWIEGLPHSEMITGKQD